MTGLYNILDAINWHVILVGLLIAARKLVDKMLHMNRINRGLRRVQRFWRRGRVAR